VCVHCVNIWLMVYILAIYQGYNMCLGSLLTSTLGPRLFRGGVAICIRTLLRALLMDILRTQLCSFPPFFLIYAQRSVGVMSASIIASLLLREASQSKPKHFDVTDPARTTFPPETSSIRFLLYPIFHLRSLLYNLICNAHENSSIVRRRNVS